MNDPAEGADAGRETSTPDGGQSGRANAGNIRWHHPLSIIDNDIAVDQMDGEPRLLQSICPLRVHHQPLTERVLASQESAVRRELCGSRPSDSARL
jgi:hypothetical protein